MMGLYSDYSDDDLQLEIDDLKAKIIAAAKAEDAGLAVIAGEGRRLEWTRNQGKGVANLANLRELLREAEAEYDRRNGTGGNRAIGVIY